MFNIDTLKRNKTYIHPTVSKLKRPVASSPSVILDCYYEKESSNIIRKLGENVQAELNMDHSHKPLHQVKEVPKQLSGCTSLRCQAVFHCPILSN